jgi:hypothetical protein
MANEKPADPLRTGRLKLVCPLNPTPIDQIGNTPNPRNPVRNVMEDLSETQPSVNAPDRVSSMAHLSTGLFHASRRNPRPQLTPEQLERWRREEAERTARREREEVERKAREEADRIKRDAEAAARLERLTAQREELRANPPRPAMAPDPTPFDVSEQMAIRGNTLWSALINSAGEQTERRATYVAFVEIGKAVNDALIAQGAIKKATNRNAQHALYEVRSGFTGLVGAEIEKSCVPWRSVLRAGAAILGGISAGMGLSAPNERDLVRAAYRLSRAQGELWIDREWREGREFVSAPSDEQLEAEKIANEAIRLGLANPRDLSSRTLPTSEVELPAGTEDLTAHEYALGVGASAPWTGQQIAELLTRMNRQHGLAVTRDGVRYISRDVGANGKPELLPIKISGLRALYRDATVSVGGKRVSAFDLWNSWPLRKRYQASELTRFGKKTIQEHLADWLKAVLAGEVPEIVLSETAPTAILRDVVADSAARWLKDNGCKVDPHKALLATLKAAGVGEGREARQKFRAGRRYTYVFPPTAAFTGTTEATEAADGQ